MSELVPWQGIGGAPRPVSSKAVQLSLAADLNDMAAGWTQQELDQQRRIVVFKRTQTADQLAVSFRAATVADQPLSGIVVSCIRWARRGAYFVTSTDTIHLLEKLLQKTFTGHEKQRIRSSFKPSTLQIVSRDDAKTQDFYKVIVNFKTPKPFRATKTTKLLRWEDLAPMLRKIVGLHSVSTSPSVSSTPITNTMKAARPQSKRRDAGGRNAASCLSAERAAEASMARKRSLFGVLSTHGHRARALPAAGLPSPQTMCAGAEDVSTDRLAIPTTGHNIFGVGRGYPFHEFSRQVVCLSDVIFALPSDKGHVDRILGYYFEHVDPVYAMIDKERFYNDFEDFWKEKAREGPAFLALVFAMLALGVQSAIGCAAEDWEDVATFHISVSNKALQMSSHGGTSSVRAVQAMVLITEFLINDGRIEAAWDFAGALVPQAYALELHRHPGTVTPAANIPDKQQRLRAWRAVYLQNTFLATVLSRPASATPGIVDDETDVWDTAWDPTDTAYGRGSYKVAKLARKAIGGPRYSTANRSELVQEFEGVYRTFPGMFWRPDVGHLETLAKHNPRAARQTWLLTNEYYHNLMLVYASASKYADALRTLVAAHNAINAFFMLHRLSGAGTRDRWASKYNAVVEAVHIGTVICEVRESGGELMAPLLSKSRADVEHMLEILKAEDVSDLAEWGRHKLTGLVQSWDCAPNTGWVTAPALGAAER
ncbi:zn 2cys6 transcription factor [Pleurostoma richardsiae]|uniref:Zn 2cys6 transcription factor n=1 Tax=Pleurostoma richardsiae TaxID=41990 RepID=A0AA38VDW7_9PEZI|nr:zn 2cys6 transcription factor [Pleurostoma richardsiae]